MQMPANTDGERTEESGAGESTAHPESSKELRIALVLNGGVSLAVWIGGVVHEINRLRVASRGATGASAAWSELVDSEHASRRIAIDLIAGTSAGGLNGAMLAAAIASGAEVPNMRSVWEQVGSLRLGALVREPASDGASTLNSVLDGAKVLSQITETLETIASGATPTDAEGCTLLVTATALDSPARAIRLATGRSVPTRDSRRVYRFRKGPSQQGAGDFADVDCVATAMRATSSFPGAFEPVLETGDLMERRRGREGGPARWLIDGGVLDNAPFEPLLEELMRTPISGAQERVVVYVTPSTDSASTIEQGPGPLPGMFRTLAGVYSALSEPDQRIDYELLSKTFESMNFISSQPHTLLGEVSFNEASSTPIIAAGMAMFTSYRRSRYEAMIRFLDSRSAREPVMAPGLPVPDVPGGSPGIPSQFTWQSEWEWGVPTADRVLRWIGRALSERAMELGEPATLEPAIAAVREAQILVQQLNTERQELVTIIGAREVVRPRQLQALTNFYQLQSQILSERMGAVFMKLAEVGGDDEQVLRNRIFRNTVLAVEVIYCCMNWGGQQYDTPSFNYIHLTPSVPPNEGLQLRFTGSGDPSMWPERKLYGSLWGHFGAFATSEGVKHDWLWGRLDCAELIADHLCSKGVPNHEVLRLKRALAAEIVSEEVLSSSGSDSDLGHADSNEVIPGSSQVSRGAAEVFTMDHTKLLRRMWNNEDGEQTIDAILARIVAIAHQELNPGRKTALVT
jgi:predicted acylesterase/phospholipase RssA